MRVRNNERVGRVKTRIENHELERNMKKDKENKRGSRERVEKVKNKRK